VLLAGAIAALVWSNSPWWESYESVWTTDVSVSLGDAGLTLDLRHLINQGLMTFFFLVVGLEAKRELDVGELRDRGRIALPAFGAVAGVAGAVLVYLAFNAGGGGAHGWGAAMSTDTAFSLGVLAVLAREGTRMRVALLAFAVVDDLIALLVIATVYSDDLDLMALAVAAALFAALVALRYLPVGPRRQIAAALGVAIWIALYESGIDPVIAGLAVGLVTTAYPPERTRLEEVTELTRSFREQPTPEMARSAQLGVASVISPNERLQYRLHPWTSYVIVPLFALANTGVHVDGDLIDAAIGSPITMGIFFGYLVGKPLGVLGGAWLGSRRFMGGTRRSLSWPAIAALGAVGGVGFTVSLLVASIAFTGQDLDEAKLGVFSGAIASTAVAALVLQVMRRLPETVRARQLGATVGDIADLSDDVDPERDHIRGAPDAAVTLLEYGDYECPYCGQAEVVVRELLESFGDDLRYVWRHLPLADVHQHAQLAAEAAEAAAAQGAFWEMHDLLLAHQDELTVPALLRYVRDLGLDEERFKATMHSPAPAARVSEDVASADASGVVGTPSFFINGRRHRGAYDVETLTARVRSARNRARLTATA
jgi:Na+/H+ antiporter NhaA